MTLLVNAATSVVATGIAVDVPVASAHSTRIWRLWYHVRELVRLLGWPVLGRLTISVLDLAGMAYVLHGFLPLIGQVQWHLSPRTLLIISGDLTVQNYAAPHMALVSFTSIALVRMLPGDVLTYIIARRGREYFQAHHGESHGKRRIRRCMALFGRWRPIRRLCVPGHWVRLKWQARITWVKGLGGWPLLAAVFVLKVFAPPFVPMVPPAAIAGAARANRCWTAVVIVLAGAIRIMGIYLAATSWR